MRLPLLTVSIGAALLAAASARAADMVPPEPPTYAPPPAVVAPPPVVVAPPPVVAVPVARPAPCWRYGAVGWGWYPCVAGPPPYWRGYRYGYPYWRGGYRYGDGYAYGYGSRRYWGRPQRWHRW